MTYFIYNKSGKRGLRLSINRFVQLNHNYHNVQNINVTKNLYQNKVHAVKMLHSNYNTTLCKKSKTHSKTSTKTNGANFRLGSLILVAAALTVISSSLRIQLSFYSTLY